MTRIVLNTFGSFGDLHPYLAVAIELKRRGHEPVVATAEVYRGKIEAEGIAFAPVRPDVGELLHNEELVRKLWHPRRGSEYLIRDYLMPALDGSYEDLLPLVRSADLLVTHFATFAAPIVAEKLQVPWLSVALQPAVFLSKYDPPVLAPAPWLHGLRVLGPAFVGAMLRLGVNQTASWTEPVTRLRQRVGLPQSKTNPLKGQFSRFGTLAWFSRHFAQAQKDWPANTRLTGFVFYDKRGAQSQRSPEADHATELEALGRFLAEGPPPVLFTLGSSAVMEPGAFYHESLDAAGRLGVRAVLLAGFLEKGGLGPSLPDSVYIASYAPYSDVMPKCAALVHQGGIGTTAQALRAGKPMVVVPWSHDQPDNAHRIQRLGVGRALSRSHYRAARVARELDYVLKSKEYSERASHLGAEIAKEDGTAAACDAIEETLRTGARKAIGNIAG